MARHLATRGPGRDEPRTRRRFGRSWRWLAFALPVAAIVVSIPTLAGRIGLKHAAASACKETTDLVVMSSVDKAPLLTKFARDFSLHGRDAVGRCVRVTVVPKASGATEAALAAGWPATTGPQPDVWSPSGSIWLPLLEDQLATKQMSSLIPSPETVPHLVSSPMVVAMPRPMAEALGWPGKPIGWSDLLRLASSQTGWGQFGHPEWGRFTLGKTNPNFSHAGLEGTIATYYAAVGRTSGLTLEDISRADTRRFVAGVEQAIARYGDNTSAFMADWQRADDNGQAMSFISAVVTEENLVPSYNEGNPTADPKLAGKHAVPKVSLVAVYPKEGTFIADHPYAVLSEPWVSDAKRAAAAALLTYLRSAKVQKEWQDNHYRTADDVAGPKDSLAEGVIPTEPSSVLQPPPANITNAVLASWVQLRKTANVLSVIDVSGSMKEQLPGSSQTKLDAAKKAAISSLSLFTDHDEVGLWSFAGGIAGKQDYQARVPIGPMDGAVGHTVRRQALADALQSLQASGNTGLYNTIAAAYQTVLDRYQPDRINAIVVLTDGKNDAVGGLDLVQLLALIAKTPGGKPVRIITIAYGPDADATVLAKIAHSTGGAAYVAPGPADIPKVYSAALSNF